MEAINLFETIGGVLTSIENYSAKNAISDDVRPIIHNEITTPLVYGSFDVTNKIDEVLL